MLSARQICTKLLEFNDPDQPDFDPKAAASELIDKPGVWQGPEINGWYQNLLSRFEEQGRGQARGQSRTFRSHTDVPLKGTRLRRDQDGTVAVQYYNTDVISCAPDGTITVDTGGFHTVTTAHRMVNYLPPGWSVYRRDRRVKGQRGFVDEQLYWACEGIPKVYEQRLSDGDSITASGLLTCKAPPIKIRMRGREEA